MSDQVWVCPNCGSEVTTCVPVQGVWCSCPGRLTKTGTAMVPKGDKPLQPKRPKGDKAA